MNRRLTTTLAAAVLLAAAGCSAQAEPGTDAGFPPVTETAAPPAVAEPSPEPTTEEPAPEPEPTEEEPASSSGTVAFGETWTYSDGLEVTVASAGPVAVAPDAYGVETTGGEALALEITIKNNTGATFDPSVAMTSSVSYGDAGTTAEQVFDGTYGGDMFTGAIPAGKSKTVVEAYGIPHAELGDVVVVFAPSFDHEDAVFMGSAK
jgi:hypothetical protein